MSNDTLTLTRKDLTPEDLVFWCESYVTDMESIWYSWGNQEFTALKNVSYVPYVDLYIFCCLRNGLFHFIEDWEPSGVNPEEN